MLHSYITCLPQERQNSSYVHMGIMLAFCQVFYLRTSSALALFIRWLSGVTKRNCRCCHVFLATDVFFQGMFGEVILERSMKFTSKLENVDQDQPHI